MFGLVIFIFEGGILFYSFLFNGGDIIIESIFEDLVFGDYELLVIDQNGCFIIVFFIVDEVVGINDFISLIDVFKVFLNLV